MDSRAASNSDFVGRIVRALRLDRTVFAEVEADTSATGMAWTVVIIATISTALAGFISELIAGPRYGSPVVGLGAGLLTALFGFLVWSFVIYFVGTKMFGGTATVGEVIRALGFAYSPNIFGIVGGLPVVGGLLAFIISIWALIAGYFAVKESLDLDTTKAILTMIISAIALFVVVFVLAIITAAVALALGLGAAAVTGGGR
ncbi:MAG: Yip1 family protein [Dehalococcoidia bacterium]